MEQTLCKAVGLDSEAESWGGGKICGVFASDLGNLVGGPLCNSVPGALLVRWGWGVGVGGRWTEETGPASSPQVYRKAGSLATVRLD